MRGSLKISLIEEFSRRSSLTGLKGNSSECAPQILKTGVFKIGLKVNIEGPQIEVPLILRDYIENIVSTSHVEPQCLYLNLFDVSYSFPPSMKTASSIFTYFLSRSVGYLRSKVITPIGEVYYGGRGYILDSDNNLLVFMVMAGILNPAGILQYVEPRVYIHPKVFSSKGTVERGIVKILIPSLLDLNISLRNTHLAVQIYPGTRTPKIIISDVTNNYISTSTKPTSILDQNNINDFLCEHSEEVIHVIESIG